MTNITRIVDVEPLRPHWLRLTFGDGSIHEVDVGKLDSGVFERIHSDGDLFAQVAVDAESGTIRWPGNVDLDPDVLYGRQDPGDGRPYPRRVIRGPDVASAPRGA